MAYSTSPIKIGKMDSHDKLGTDLHNAAKIGNKKLVKKTIAKGINVDYPNSKGQSALFQACFEDQDAVVQVLLQYGANPNERSDNGITPVHVAAYIGNVRLLMSLITEGGDLRLHDTDGKTVKDWALMQADPKRRLKMIEFLEKTKLFALTQSGHDIRMDYGLQQNKKRSWSRGQHSVIRKIQNMIKGESNIDIQCLKSSPSLGFGKVYVDQASHGCIMSSIPLISESYLQHDSERNTYDNGAFMVMQSMVWGKTKVTVKRLHRETDPGGEVDLLINEAEYMGKIRHPNVLLLMGVCQTNNLDGMVLLYEDVGLGSLYFYLHQKLERMPSAQILEISQQICDALLFLHEQNLIHCFVSSHAVNLINPHLAKLGNFDYMIDSHKSEAGRKSFVTTNIYPNAAYNWMAPEIMNDNPPTESSDMYSYCVVLWEMLRFEIPWGTCKPNAIVKKMIEERQQLPVDHSRIEERYSAILEYGLQLDPLHRQLTFTHLQELLSQPAQNIAACLKQIFKPERPKRSPTPGRESVPGSSRKAKNERKDLTSPNHYRQEYQNGSTNQKRHNGKHAESQQLFENKREHRARYREKRKHQIKNNDVAKYDKNQNGGNYQDFAYYPGVVEPSVRFVDGMQFSHKNTDWNLQEEHQGNEFYYTINVNGVSKSCGDKDGEKYIGKALLPSESEETCASEISHDEEGNKKSNHPLSTRFSYLQVQQNRSPGSCTVKPASHCTAPNIEKPIDKQLTTAGSIYALYNMNLDEKDQSPSKPLTDSNYSTMPRKRKRLAATPEAKFITTDLEKDENWFGGKGSVRNLVDLYQQQENCHKMKQAVLDGTLKTVSPEKGLTIQELDCPVESAHPRMINFELPSEAGTKTEQKTSPRCPSLYPDLHQDATNCSSLTTVSSSDSPPIKKAESNSSVDSALIERWVSDEVIKVHNCLSDEIFQELARKEQKENRQQILPKDRDRQSAKPHDKKRASVKHHCKDFKVEEFYLDDDFSSGRIGEESHMQLQESTKQKGLKQKSLKQKSLNCDGNLRSSFHELPTYISGKKSDFTLKQYSPPTRDQENHNYPQFLPATSMLHYEKMKNKTDRKGAYQSTVTVESSLTRPDQHTVTHTLTDLQDGTTSTLYGKSIRASKVVSSLFSNH